MKFFLPKPLTIVDSNIGDNIAEDGSTYTVYSKTAGYNKGAVVKYESNIYTALTTIYPPVKYIWEDLISTAKYAYDLPNEAVMPNSASIPCTANVTVVYVRSLVKYYMAKTTGNIDFTAQNPITPSDFTEIVAPPPIPYRIDSGVPSGAENTLYWGYTAVANKFRAFDSAINSQTSFLNEIYYKFSVNAVSGLAFLNANCETLRIKITDTFTSEVIYDVTTTMKDSSALTNYEKVCTVPPINLRNFYADVPSRYSQSLEVWFTAITGSDAKIGSIKGGLVDLLGQTLDGVDFDNKSYNSVSQRANGEYVWGESNSDANKVFNVRYNIKIETAVFDSMVNKLKDITDKEVVLIGDDSDTVVFRTLINYGAVKNASGSLSSNSTKSKLSSAIENFI